MIRAKVTFWKLNRNNRMTLLSKSIDMPFLPALGMTLVMGETIIRIDGMQWYQGLGKLTIEGQETYPDLTTYDDLRAAGWERALGEDDPE